MILDKQAMERVPLSRNRFLAATGATLTAIATSMWFPSAAEASAPAGCGAEKCSCCSGSNCCASGCTSIKNACPSGQQRWVLCYRGIIIRCCTWMKSGQLCDCRFVYAGKYC
jgi:hypothetical protein